MWDDLKSEILFNRAISWLAIAIVVDMRGSRIMAAAALVASVCNVVRSIVTTMKE